MPITRTAIVDDDGTGKTGTVIDNAWKQQFYDQIDALYGGGVPAAWTARPFVAGNYTATAPLVWTATAGHIVTDRYCVIGGKTLLWSFSCTGVALTGAAGGGLRIQMPTGAAKGSITVPFAYGYNGTAHQTHSVSIVAGVSYVDVIRQDYGSIAPMTGLYMNFNLTIELA
jgi:hypothetical protein